MPSLSAIAHIRRLRGGSQSHLLRASDGNLYVTKFQNNPQHIRVLANEMFATRLGQALGLPIPQVEVIEVPDWLTINTPELSVETGGCRIRCSTGRNWHADMSKVMELHSTICRILPWRVFATLQISRVYWSSINGHATAMDDRRFSRNQESTSKQPSLTRDTASTPESGAFQILRCEAFTRRPAFTNPSLAGRASNPPSALQKSSSRMSSGNVLRTFLKNGMALTPKVAAAHQRTVPAPSKDSPPDRVF